MVKNSNPTGMVLEAVLVFVCNRLYVADVD